MMTLDLPTIDELGEITDIDGDCDDDPSKGCTETV